MRTIVLLCTLILTQSVARAALTAPHDDFSCDAYAGECDESPAPTLTADDLPDVSDGIVDDSDDDATQDDCGSAESADPGIAP